MYTVAGALAAIGAAETAYLTFTKLVGSSVACGAEGGGCSDILSSAYSEILGIPLPALGFLTYSAVSLVALQGASKVKEGESDSTEQMALRGGAAVLASTSAYLMFTLFTKLDGVACPYCFASATLSALILAASVPGSRSSDVPKGAGMSLAVFLALAIGFGDVADLTSGGAANAAAPDLYIEYRKPPITTVSDEKYKALAAHLTSTGAKMYGAFWCSHCNDQKVAFGAEAAATMPYVECFPDGFKRETVDGKTSTTKMETTCSDAGVKAFPTWVINGKIIEGELSYKELTKASDFQD